ncbi:MAG: hypothetical protein QFX33_00565 [Candidatus Nezhaarchaeota archaeon]|nr:hypothetical protein [Candidatus Nezhaarchaeota archaeon]
MGSKYRRLVKPLTVGEAPEGLFPRDVKVFWMESKDLEGYPGHLGIAYLEGKCALHPAGEGKMVVHPYDELIAVAGTNPEDIMDLGGEASILIGEEREEYTFREPTVVVVPKNTPHGPLRVKELERPLVHLVLSNSPLYSGETVGCARQPSKGTRYSRLVKRLATSKSAYEGWRAEAPIKIDERGVMDMRSMGPGEAYQMVQMHPEDLEGVNISFSWEFFKTTGVWMSTRYAHVHREPELLVALGLDPSRIHELGASIEFWFGSEREVYVIDKPTIITIPRPWIPHTPAITQRVDRPFAFMLICPGSYSVAGYVETGDDV